MIKTHDLKTAVVDGIGVLLEVNSETDFVAKNADFQQFVANVAKQIKEKTRSRKTY